MDLRASCSKVNNLVLVSASRRALAHLYNLRTCCIGLARALFQPWHGTYEIARIVGGSAAHSLSVHLSRIKQERPSERTIASAFALNDQEPLYSRRRNHRISSVDCSDSLSRVPAPAIGQSQQNGGSFYRRVGDDGRRESRIRQSC